MIGSSPPYAFTQTYDSVGRPRDTQYPTGFTTRNLYNYYGFLKEIRRADDGSNLVYWMAQNYSATGRIDSEIYGNGLANDRVYSQATRRLKTAKIGKAIETGPLYSIHNLAYTYDQVGNVLSRTEGSTNRSETFTYDGLDRLKTHALSGSPTVSVTYYANGNIATKSDVGTYAYDSFRPHALTGVSGGAHGNHTYSYDPNGNMTGGGGRAITWTSFNHIAEVSQGGQASTFTYGANRERIVQNSTSALTVYVGSLYEKVTPAGQSAEHKHYIMGPTGRIAVHTARSTGIVLAELNYFHTDGLGSITAVTNEKGAVVKRFAFDAWGKRLDPATGNAITPATNGQITRGYTDHEHLHAVGLVHMNGRVYDPVLGRFLSADPHIDGVSDAQGYNRYSYVGNNPMNATDPSGYFKLKDILPAIIAVVATAVVLVATAGTAALAAGVSNTFFAKLGWALANFGTHSLIAGAAGGFAGGFSGSLLNGGSLGDAFRLASSARPSVLALRGCRGRLVVCLTTEKKSLRTKCSLIGPAAPLPTVSLEAWRLRLKEEASATGSIRQLPLLA